MLDSVGQSGGQSGQSERMEAEGGLFVSQESQHRGTFSVTAAAQGMSVMSKFSLEKPTNNLGNHQRAASRCAFHCTCRDAYTLYSIHK